jgi:hypothetical protein
VTVTVQTPSAALQARIASPRGLVVQSQDGNTTVALDAAGSLSLPGRPIQQYAWEVRTSPPALDPALLLTAFGPRASVQLPSGSYNATLRASDGTGLSSSASVNFLVGAGQPDGLIAVIAAPRAWVPPPAGLSGGARPIALDALGTAPSPGSTLTQWVWAVISLPEKEALANATGPLASVSLPPGDYQVGLLAIDASGDNAIAKKNFTVAGAGSPAGANLPPVVPAGLVARGPAGGAAALRGVSDPDGDAVAVEWTIDPSGLGIPGQGAAVSLRGVPPGRYELSLVARDSRGGASSGTATLEVLPPGGGGGGGSAGAGGSGGSAGAGGIELRELDLRLPSLTLSSGAAVILDAGAAGVPPGARNDYSYSWQLSRKASGQWVAGVAGPVARFNLSGPDSLALLLTAQSKRTGSTASATGAVRAIARPQGAPPLPQAAAGARCGPLTATGTGAVRLACQDLRVVTAAGGAPASARGAPYTNASWAWRVTSESTGAVRTAIGREFDAGRWAVAVMLRQQGLAGGWGLEGEGKQVERRSIAHVHRTLLEWPGRMQSFRPLSCAHPRPRPCAPTARPLAGWPRAHTW